MTVTTDNPEVDISLVSFSQIVFEKEMTSNKAKVNVGGMNAGIYLCRFLDKGSGNIYQEKIVVR